MKSGWMIVCAAVAATACGPQAEATQGQPASGQAADAAVFAAASLEDLRGLPGSGAREGLACIEEECSGRPLGFRDGSITSADLNDDGRADYLVEMSGATCGGEPTGQDWCGSRGCAYDIYLSRPEGYVVESLLGGAGKIIQRDGGRAISFEGVEGPFTMAWDGSQLAHVDDGAASAPAASQASGDEAAVRSVVAQIYDPYTDNSNAGMPHHLETPRLRQAIEASIDPEIGGLEGDYYCGCQDFGDVSYEIESVGVSGDGATATIRFTNFGETTSINLQFRKIDGRWLVDDVIDSHGRLRDQLGIG